MDRTALARTLLESIPAHRTTLIEVVRAADGAAEIATRTPPELTNVIGSLHSSGLVALLDATGLGAIIAASTGGLKGLIHSARLADHLSQGGREQFVTEPVEGELDELLPGPFGKGAR